MKLSRESDENPEVTPRVIELARERNLQIVNVVCDEDGSKIGDITGITFIALCPTVPRSGESIILENGMRCVVRNVFYQAARVKDEQGKSDAAILIPNVVAFASDRRGSR